MKFLRDLIARKRTPAAVVAADVSDFEQVMADRSGAKAKEAAVSGDAPLPESTAAILSKVDSEVKNKQASVKKAAAVNIWDLDDDGDADTPAETEAAPVRATSRARRTKTRLIGFDKSDGATVDTFADAPVALPTQRAKFPVGWILVTEGPGYGESFSLLTGMSQIGRGEDQAVQLDFGDSAISRSNHAAIVFDPETKGFTLGHGGKSNIVRLNNAPVISNETLKSGDIIRLGETTLRFVALVGDDFEWTKADNEENEDVAIA